MDAIRWQGQWHGGRSIRPHCQCDSARLLTLTCLVLSPLTRQSVTILQDDVTRAAMEVLRRIQPQKLGGLADAASASIVSARL
jgi:hypothetical protein